LSQEYAPAAVQNIHIIDRWHTYLAAHSISGASNVQFFAAGGADFSSGMDEHYKSEIRSGVN
jgi:hypothetical protein